VVTNREDVVISLTTVVDSGEEEEEIAEVIGPKESSKHRTHRK
jgi:hypothetical protein